MKNIVLNEKDYIIRELDGETIILNPTSGDSHLLDEVATIFLSAIQQCDDKSRAIQSLLGYFADVNEDILSKDFDEFFEDMIYKNILIRQ